jgi:hypothetical protein
MALKHVLGEDLSTEPGAVTGYGEAKDAKNSVTITVTGPISSLSGNVPPQGATHTDFDYIPTGCYVQSARLTSDGNGMGTMTVNCVDPGADSEQTPATPTKVTYKISMSAEQTDLICHPVITASTTVVDMCLKWLATDDAKKIDENGNYQYLEADGTTYTPITDQTATKFCNAWMHGIKTFNRYFPVVEKISTYKRPPGLTMNGAIVTGGTPTFSQNIGTWNAPDITLSGYESTGWFKCGDDWTNSADEAWVRTEQWTWTPDGSSSNYGWIYQASGGNE